MAKEGKLIRPGSDAFQELLELSSLCWILEFLAHARQHLLNHGDELNASDAQAWTALLEASQRVLDEGLADINGRHAD